MTPLPDDHPAKTISLEEMAENTGHTADWLKRQIAAKGFEYTRFGREIRFTTAQAEALVRAYMANHGGSNRPEFDDPLRTQTSRSRRTSRKPSVPNGTRPEEDVIGDRLEADPLSSVITRRTPRGRR